MKATAELDKICKGLLYSNSSAVNYIVDKNELSTFDRLYILCYLIKVVCKSNRKLRYKTIEEIDTWNRLDSLGLQFNNCQSMLEDLEVVIDNWYTFAGHASLSPKYYNVRYKQICEIYGVTHLHEIILKDEIMSSELTTEEKEYLKLKYFI